MTRENLSRTRVDAEAVNAILQQRFEQIGNEIYAPRTPADRIQREILERLNEAMKNLDSIIETVNKSEVQYVN